MANSPSIGKLRMFLDDHLMSTSLYRKYCLWILRNWFETKTSQVTFGQFLMPRIHKLLVASLVWNRSNVLEVEREKNKSESKGVAQEGVGGWPDMEGGKGGWVANALCWQTIRPLMYLCTFCSLAFQYMSGLFQADFMTNIEQTLNKVCDIKLEIYLMPLDAFGEAEDCGPAFWQLCIHPVNILIDKYPKITLKYRTKILKICFYWKYVDSARPPPALFSDKGWCG